MTHQPISGKDTLPGPNHLSEVAQKLFEAWDVNCDLERFTDTAQVYMVEKFMKQEVVSLCGERYEHDDLYGKRYCRWGTNPGSIAAGMTRNKIRVPRVRDTQTGKERPLESYQMFHNPSEKAKEKMSECIFLGVSQRDYHRVPLAMEESYGLSASSNSRVMKETGIQALKEFEAKDLSEDTYVILMLDGTHMRGHHIIACAGITEDGEKQTLGFIEASNENANAVAGLLENLVERGLRYDQGILCVMDGAKGIHKAVCQVFGEYAQIQRCTWHKQENVTNKVPRKNREAVKNRFNEAIEKDTYGEAKQELTDLGTHLDTQGHHKAANSLREGMEELLTLHRLGVGKELRKRLRTSNIMENLNGLLKGSVGKVKRWVNSNHCQRWVAMGLIEAEPRMRKIPETGQLAALQKALLEQVQFHQLTTRINQSKMEDSN